MATTATAGKDADRSGMILDPHAGWLLMIDSIGSGHWRVVREQAEDLLEWMELGEPPPNITNGKVTDPQWNRHVAVYACKLAKLIARRRLRG